jgi:DNA topoisomerase-2
VLSLEPEYYAKAKAAPEDFEKLFKLTTSWKTTNMCAFDTKMNIVKYDSVGDILEEFYTHRVVAYEARRQHQIATLRDQIEELNAKLVFVQAIVEGRLKIMNEEDETILAGLKALALPPRSDRDAPDTLGAFEYLLRMRVDRIKKKSVEEARSDLETVKGKLDALEKMTAERLWRAELDEFEAAWTDTEKHMLEILRAATNTDIVPKKKKIMLKKK